LKPPACCKAVALVAAALLFSRPAAAARVADVQLFQPVCSQADPARVARALQAADALLRKSCGVGLRLASRTALPLGWGYCHLPADPAARQRRLAQLARALPRRHARCLALVLLPDGADPRLAWTLIDISTQAGCGSPREARFLDRFGVMCFSDGAWASSAPPPELLVLHEALHALTQRGHPTGAVRGEALADHLADIGPRVPQDACLCAQQSPYLVERP
jgi:hypothetical protein